MEEILKLLKEMLFDTNNDPEIAKTIISYLEKCEMCDKYDNNLKEKHIKECWGDECETCGGEKFICKDCYRNNHCFYCQDVFCKRDDIFLCDTDSCNRKFCDDCNYRRLCCNNCGESKCCVRHYNISGEYTCVKCITMVIGCEDSEISDSYDSSDEDIVKVSK